MKVIELDHNQPTLDEVMALAGQELVVLRQSGSQTFVVTQVDEFDVEVELLKRNEEFMALLKQLGQEPASISLGDLRKELGL